MSVSDLAGESFVSLTTYRRNGEGVPTPVWVAADAGDGSSLVVTTVDGSGKVTRIRNDPHVTLRPCNRSGKVAGGAATVEGRAVVVTDAVESLTAPIRRKYGMQFKLVMLLERVVGRGRVRVILRITDPT